MVNFDGNGGGAASEGMSSTGVSCVPITQPWSLASVALTRIW